MTTLTIDGRKVTVDDSFLKLSPEDQEATVEEIAASLPPRDETSAINWVNRGISNTLTGLGNIGTAAVNPVIDGINAVAGTEIPRMHADAAPLMRQAGIVIPEGQPEGFTQNLAMGSGEAAGALIPGGVVVGGLRQGTGTVANIADDVANQFTRSRAATIGATSGELAGGGGARVGEEIAEDEGFGPTGQMVGGILGGVAGGLATAPITVAREIPGAADGIIRRMPLMGLAYKKTVDKVQKDFFPYTRKGSFIRASERVRGVTADADEAIRNLHMPNEYGLSPAQQTGDSGMMALEHAVNASDPKLMKGAEIQNAEASSRINSQFRSGVSSTSGLRDFVEARRDVFRQTLKQTVDDARTRAAKRTAELAPGQSQMANAQIVREEITKAFDEVKATEGMLWGEIPREHRVGTSNARAALDDAIASTPQAQRFGQDDVPAVAVELLGPEGLGNATTVSELHGLYSRLREMSRNLRAGTAPRKNAARIADNIAEGILKDLGVSADKKTALGEQIGEAIDFSRNMNEVYNQGNVARILGRTADGGEKVADGLTLQTVGRGGNDGAQAIDDINQAASGDRSGVAMADYLRGRFEEIAVREGQINPRSAETFMARNRAVLDRMPALEVELRAGIEAQKRADSVAASAAARGKRAESPRQSATAAVEASRYGEEIDAIFKTQNPVETARSIRRTALRDPSGNANRSLKGGFLDYLIKGSETGGFDTMGNRMVSGNALVAKLNDPRTLDVAKIILSEPEVNRLRMVAREAQKLERSMTTRAAGQIIDDAPATFLTAAVRIAGAKAATRVAGRGSGAGVGLQAANLGSNRAADILNSLTNDAAEQLIKDAIHDKELMTMLLSGKINVPQQSRKQADMLVEWLAGYTATQMAEDE